MGRSIGPRCGVPFHVEISGSMQHARVFNLNKEDLLAKVVGPWLENRPIEMGDREWLPSESGLRILDGPQMEPQDLAFGQGWSNAHRASEDVTREVLESAPPPRSPQAILLEAEAPGRAPQSCSPATRAGRSPGARRGRGWTVAIRRSRPSSSSSRCGWPDPQS